MDKNTLKKKIEQGGYSKEQLIKWVDYMPSPRNKPIRNKKGDVYMHSIFRHPIVLLKQKQGVWICMMLTTDKECNEVLEPCQSRFYPNSFITQSLITITGELPKMFMGIYDNNRHLTEVYNKLKKMII